MKRECSIVRDVLPLYFENMVSEDTAVFVKEHLENCSDCDNEDLKYLEERYDQLQLSHTVKRVIDDYIACLQTRDERYSDLAYAAGIRDTISLLQGMGMLNGTAAISGSL